MGFGEARENPSQHQPETSLYAGEGADFFRDPPERGGGGSQTHPAHRRTRGGDPSKNRAVSGHFPRLEVQQGFFLAFYLPLDVFAMSKSDFAPAKGSD